MTREEFPETMVEIIERAARQHSEDITKGVECAKRDIQSLPEYHQLIDTLVTEAIRELIYDVRHRDNVKMRNESGAYSIEPKVQPGKSKDVQETFENLHRYFLAGQTLGEIMGEQLEGIAESEESKANGHLFNARLCRELSRLVPEGKRVKDVVSLKKLGMIFKKLKGDRKGDAA